MGAIKMSCPYKEGSEYCWLCWNWMESAEYCLYDEDDPQREFVLIDEFKNIDPQTYKERLEWIKGLGLLSLYQAVKARTVKGQRKEQRTLSDFGVVMSHE